jgi:hypothetical protein
MMKARPAITCISSSSLLAASDADTHSFICGTLSPVSDASLMTALPLSSRQSQGMMSSAALLGAEALAAEVRLGEMEIMSPGRMSWLMTVSHFPQR